MTSEVSEGTSPIDSASDDIKTSNVGQRDGRGESFARGSPPPPGYGEARIRQGSAEQRSRTPLPLTRPARGEIVTWFFELFRICVTAAS